MTFTRPAVGGRKGKKKKVVMAAGGGGGGGGSNTSVYNPPDDQDEEIELKPNGKNIDVTDTNKDEYASLLLHAYTHTTYGNAAQAMRQGLLDVLLKNQRLLRLFNPPEFSVVVGGIGEIDVHDWQTHTDVVGFASADGSGRRVIEWFWTVVYRLTREEKALLLKFATGHSRLPVGGFGKLSPRFCLQQINYRASMSLPMVSVCVCVCVCVL